MVGKKHKHNLNDAKHKEKHHLLLKMATTGIMHHGSFEKKTTTYFYLGFKFSLLVIIF